METETHALQVAVSLLELKLRNIDSLPEEERDLLGKLVGIISMLPNRYKTGSSSTYYKEKYANQVRKIIDQIANDPDHKSLLLDASKLGTSKNTLQQRIFQSLGYLKDRLDDDKKYAALTENIVVKRHMRGVVFSWVRDDLDAFEVEETEEERPDVSWRDKLDLFVDHATEGSQLELKLALTDDELLELKSMLYDLREKFVPLAVTSSRLLLRCDSILAKAGKGDDV